MKQKHWIHEKIDDLYQKVLCKKYNIVDYKILNTIYTCSNVSVVKCTTVDNKKIIIKPSYLKEEAALSYLISKQPHNNIVKIYDVVKSKSYYHDTIYFIIEECLKVLPNKDIDILENPYLDNYFSNVISDKRFTNSKKDIVKIQCIIELLKDDGDIKFDYRRIKIFNDLFDGMWHLRKEFGILYTDLHGYNVGEGGGHYKIFDFDNFHFLNRKTVKINKMCSKIKELK